MKHRPVYAFLFLALVLCLWTPALVNMCEAGAQLVPAEERGAVSGRNPQGNSAGAGPLVREEAPIKRVPLATANLGLTLVGTVVADNPGGSLAFIENGTTGKQQLFREGDRVGTALIKKILRNEVIIDAGRGDEMLTMLHGQPSGRQRAPYQVARARPSATAAGPARLDRTEIEPYLADMDQLKKQVLLYPLKEDDEPAGVLVRSIRRGSIFWRMGLRNRDVIRGVNGEPVTSPEQADALFRGLETGGALTLEVTRGRRAQELLVEIQ
jgi:general secretion pathway protein C